MKTKYVLITPAHNEEKLIEQTIKSVIVQTIPPQKWLIIDDGSIDRTGEIIKRYESQYNFIQYIRLDISEEKSYYGRKMYIISMGYDRVKDTDFDFVANLDADLTIESDYYECILTEFDTNPKLGIASGIYVNKTGDKLNKITRDPDQISTPGGLQVFRRECFESIGGYRIINGGGSDTVAGIIARMHGWETKHFPQYQAIHYRPVGTGDGSSIIKAQYYYGKAEYALGTHPLFAIGKSLRRIFSEKPYFIAAAARFAGFLSGFMKNEEKNVPDDVVKYIQKEQMERLFRWWRGKVKV